MLVLPYYIISCLSSEPGALITQVRLILEKMPYMREYIHVLYTYIKLILFRKFSVFVNEKNELAELHCAFNSRIY